MISKTSDLLRGCCCCCLASPSDKKVLLCCCARAGAVADARARDRLLVAVIIDNLMVAGAVSSVTQRDHSDLH